MTFDLAKTMENGGRCQTRDGRQARIVCTDQMDEHYPVVALVGDDEEAPQVYTSRGQYYYCDQGISDHDLVNITVKREGWVNVYPSRGHGAIHVSQNCANLNARSERIDCVRIEWEEPA